MRGSASSGYLHRPARGVGEGRLRAFVAAVSTAGAKGGVVIPGDGYACLLAGLHRAKEALEEGLPWAEELAGRARLASERSADIMDHPVPARLALRAESKVGVAAARGGGWSVV